MSFKSKQYTVKVYSHIHIYILLFTTLLHCYRKIAKVEIFGLVRTLSPDGKIIMACWSACDQPIRFKDLGFLTIEKLEEKIKIKIVV